MIDETRLLGIDPHPGGGKLLPYIRISPSRIPHRLDVILAAFFVRGLLAVLTLTAAAGSAAAQPLEATAGEPVVLAADLLAVVTPPQTEVEILIAYRLAARGSQVAPLAILELGIGRATRLAASHEGQPLELRPGRGSTSRRSLLDIVLPEALALRRELELELRYVVEGGLSGKTDGPLATSLPVAAILWPPPSEGAEAFQAEVRVPDGWSLYDPFPSGLRRLESGAAAGGVRLPIQTWQTRLPVVPSMLRFRLRRGEAPLLSPDRLADLSALALLSALAIFGWSRLRRQARR